jgi:hypothetical protein
MEDVLRETGCLAVSRVSCELELRGRLREFELNSGVTRGRKLRSDSGGGKKDASVNRLQRREIQGIASDMVSK